MLETKEGKFKKLKAIFSDPKNWEKVEPIPEQVLLFYYLLGILAIAISLYIILND